MKQLFKYFQRYKHMIKKVAEFPFLLRYTIPWLHYSITDYKKGLLMLLYMNELTIKKQMKVQQSVEEYSQISR